MKETRQLNSEELRTLCIKKEWYTRGNNEEYRELLNYANDTQNITTDDITALARDIKEHSDTEHSITSICFEIARVCNSYFEE